MTIQSLTIVGVGLIGGSIGKAARRRRMAERIVGTGLDADMLDVAQQVGAIDEGVLSLPAAVKNAEMVVFCAPVDCIANLVRAAAPHCPPGCLMTDVGSTKTSIVRSLEAGLPAKVEFVGSHPLAGSEKQGPQFSHPDLFRDRLVVITPVRESSGGAISRLIQFWEGLGAKVKVMTPETHDRALALTSHLPHLLASALAATLPPELHELTATGFRDTTRIAAGDADLWASIFEQNREAILENLRILTNRLDEFHTALENKDMATLRSLLATGKKVRDALGS